MKKIAFPKKPRTVDVGKDLEIDDYNGVRFVMWKDPSIDVISSVISSLANDVNDLSEDKANEFFESVTELIIDSNIEGLEFDTPEQTQESFTNAALPWGFLLTVVVTYVMNLVYESEALKKVLGLSQDPEISGDDKSSEE